MSARQFKRIAVFCGSSSGNDPKIERQAYELGEVMTRRGIELVYGGSKLGLMGQVAKGVLDNAGVAIGVIPEFLKTKEVVHPQLSELITTETMHQRKLKMQQLSDGFIVLPGGFGTMEEFFEIVTWAQLGLHDNPIAVLNSQGYYDEMWRLFETMVEKQILKPENLSLVSKADTVSALFAKLETAQPSVTPKWLVKE